ncbi:MAG: hypothetical protein UT34_C0001G0422 [candidate division WS6 bacterium GW2011_GWF2_39_15]|uniref:Uncharacterized protein n=1 Tax=candidate division WS6 bacterium GW2011_GWF2_39_15 TaxID=1619100 RepID=A0A0G0QXL4_9BACT|nr:MAG: hypothetical protein UT34_C0001G0422 [candidate division WS6 bacterium GW2011_GWF2_39_15]
MFKKFVRSVFFVLVAISLFLVACGPQTNPTPVSGEEKETPPPPGTLVNLTPTEETPVAAEIQATLAPDSCSGWYTGFPATWSKLAIDRADRPAAWVSNPILLTEIVSYPNGAMVLMVQSDDFVTPFVIRDLSGKEQKADPKDLLEQINSLMEGKFSRIGLINLTFAATMKAFCNEDPMIPLFVAKQIMISEKNEREMRDAFEFNWDGEKVTISD